MTFTVTLSRAYDQAVTVHFATHDDIGDGSERRLRRHVRDADLRPGQTTKTITVTIKGDTKKEADESFYVLLSNTSSNAFLLDQYGWGTILNDDARRR